MPFDQLDSSKQGTILYGQKGSRLAITVVGAQVTEDDLRDRPPIPEYLSRSWLKLPDPEIEFILQTPSNDSGRVDLVLGTRGDGFTFASLPDDRSRKLGGGYACGPLKGGDVLLIQGEPNQPMFQVMVAAID